MIHAVHMNDTSQAGSISYYKKLHIEFQVDDRAKCHIVNIWPKFQISHIDEFMAKI